VPTRRRNGLRDSLASRAAENDECDADCGGYPVSMPGHFSKTGLVAIAEEAEGGGVGREDVAKTGWIRGAGGGVSALVVGGEPVRIADAQLAEAASWGGGYGGCGCCGCCCGYGC